MRSSRFIPFMASLLATLAEPGAERSEKKLQRATVAPVVLRGGRVLHSPNTMSQKKRRQRAKWVK